MSVDNALWLFVVALWAFEGGVWWARWRARTAIGFHKLMIAEMARVHEQSKWLAKGSGFAVQRSLELEVGDASKFEIIIKETA